MFKNSNLAIRYGRVIAS